MYALFIGNKKKFAFTFALLLLVIGFAVTIIRLERAESLLSAVREDITSNLLSDAQKCAYIGRKMSYAGADIKGELLPELTELLPTVMRLSGIAGLLCETAPVDEALLHRVQDSANMLKAAYRQGSNAEALENALINKLIQLESSLFRK